MDWAEKQELRGKARIVLKIKFRDKNVFHKYFQNENMF